MSKFQLNQMAIAFSILVLLAILPLGGGMLAHGRHQPKQKPPHDFTSSEPELFSLLTSEENSIFKDQIHTSELPFGVKHPKQALERLVQMLALADALEASVFPQNHDEYDARPERRRRAVPMKQLHELNAVLETLEDVDREIQQAIGEKDGPDNNAKERNDARDKIQAVDSNPSKTKSFTKKSASAVIKSNNVAVARGAARRSGQAKVHRRKFPRDSFILGIETLEFHKKAIQSLLVSVRKVGPSADNSLNH